VSEAPTSESEQPTPARRRTARRKERARFQIGRGCHPCDSARLNLSHRHGFWEHVPLRLLLIHPFRCPRCGRRYYCFHVPKRLGLSLGLALLVAWIAGVITIAIILLALVLRLVL